MLGQIASPVLHIGSYPGICLATSDAMCSSNNALGPSVVFQAEWIKLLSGEQSETRVSYVNKDDIGQLYEFLKTNDTGFARC